MLTARSFAPKARASRETAVQAGLQAMHVRAITYARAMRSGDPEPDAATSGGSETPVREVDRRNGNKARALRQRARAESPRVVEAADGSVHRLKSTTLVVPEEKRCKAMTVRGERCRVGKMRGMEVCIFHAHRALSEDALATLADPETTPRLSPRKALKAVVALRAEELAEAAVDGALASDGANRTRAVLQLVDAVDPLATEEASLTLSREGAQTAGWKQLRAVFGSSKPF